MAQTTYTSRQAVTLATRRAAYRRLAALFLHLDSFDLNLVSIVRNPDNTVSITLSNPIPLAGDLDTFDVE